MNRRPEILIADDHAVVADALAMALERWFRVAGIVTSLADLPDALRRLRPVVTLLDLSFGDRSSLRTLPKIVKEFPGTRFVILTAHPEQALVDAALRLGAYGYVVKNSAPAEVRVAIEEAIAGRQYITPLIKQPEDDEWIVPSELVSDSFDLNSQQIDILQRLRRGMSHRAIADSMGIATKTVEYHLEAVRSRTGITKTSQLVRWAERYLPPVE